MVVSLFGVCTTLSDPIHSMLIW